MPASARHKAPAAIPPRAMLMLGVAVVVAHMLVVRSVSLSLDAPERLSPRVFSIRSVEIKTAPAQSRALPRRPVTVAPRPRPEPAPGPRARSDGVMSAATRASAPSQTPLDVPEPAAPIAMAMPPVAPIRSEPEEPPAVAATPAPVTKTSDAAIAAAVPASAAVAAVPAQMEPEPQPRVATRPYTVPGSVRLYFDAVGQRNRLNYKAMGSLVWLQDGASYDMRMELGDWIIGKRVLSSAGKISLDGLAPTRYSDKFHSERAAHFDRQLGRITFSGNTPPADLLPGAQDQLSIFAQLASLVAGDPLEFPVGTTVAIQTAGPRDAEFWIFKVEKEEMLNLPGGQVPALKLVRKPNKDYGQTVELWLAPELAFLPARIKITLENGDFLDQQWKSSSPP